MWWRRCWWNTTVDMLAEAWSILLSSLQQENLIPNLQCTKNITDHSSHSIHTKKVINDHASHSIQRVCVCVCVCVSDLEIYSYPITFVFSIQVVTAQLLVQLDKPVTKKLVSVNAKITLMVKSVISASQTFICININA